MLKFRKAFNLKIISILTSIVFLSNAMLYACPLSGDSLRVPVGRKIIYDSMVEKFHADSASLSPKVDLSRLIGLLKELSKKNYNNEYYLDLVNNPERLIEAVSAFKGKPERLDTVIHRQSSYRRQAAIELIANAIDAVMAENGTVLIGRFGIGAFQSLSELKDEGDYVSWTTSLDGKQALRIVVTKGKGEDEYYYQCQVVTQGVKKGTSVKVYKATYTEEEQDSLKQYIKDKLRLNYRCLIYVNGELINPLEDVLFINGNRLNYLMSTSVVIKVDENGYSIDDTGIGMDFKDVHTKLLIPRRGKELPKQELKDEEIIEQTKVFYVPQEKEAKSKVIGTMHIQVSGVIIESFEIKGYVLPKDLVIELPASTALTEDRQHVQLSPETIKAIEAAINKVITRPIKNQVELINGISGMLLAFAKRDERALDMLQYMANLMRDWRSEREKSSPNHFVYLPNEANFLLDVGVPEDKEVIYVNGSVLLFNPEDLPGAIRVSSWQSNTYSLWVLPFTESSNMVSFEFENFIIVNKAHYERHGSNLAPLDLEINPIVTGYEPAGYRPQPKGRLLPLASKELSEKQEPDETPEAGIPLKAKKVLEELTLESHILEKITDKLRRFFSPQTTYSETEIEAIINWLKRLDKFNPVLQAADLGRIVDSYKLESMLPATSKDYTRIKSSVKHEDPNLKDSYFSALLPDGRIIVSNLNDHSLAVIDLNDPSNSIKYTNNELNNVLDGPFSIAVTQDGRIIVANVFDNSLAVIDLNDPANSRKYKNRELNNVLNNPRGILVTQDGRIIVSNVDDNSLAVIDLNDPSNSRKYKNNELNNVLNNPIGILVTQDGRIIVANLDNSLAVIDLNDPSSSIKYENSELNNTLNGSAGIAVTQDGKIIVSNVDDNSLAVIDLNDPSNSIKYENHELNSVLNNTTGILVTQDGRIIVGNVGDNSLAVIEFEDLLPMPPKDYTKIKSSVRHEDPKLKDSYFSALLPDGRIIVVNIFDNSLAVIDLNGPSSSIKYENRELNNVLKNPRGILVTQDGRIIVTNFDDSLAVIDLNDPSNSIKYKNSELNNVLSGPSGIAVTQDGRIIVTNLDNSLAVIDLNDPNNSIKYENHELNNVLDYPRGILVTQDGRIIVANFDNSLAVIDLNGPSNSIKYKNSELNNVLSGPSGIAVTQDGRIIVSNFYDNSLAVIDLNDPSNSRKYENRELNNVLDYPRGILVTQDGRIIVSNVDNSLAVIEFKDLLPRPPKDYTKIRSSVKHEDPNLESPYFSALLPDGRIIVSNLDDSLAVIDLDVPANSIKYENSELNNVLSDPRGILVTQDGKIIVSNVDDNSLAVIDLNDPSNSRKYTNNELNNVLYAPRGITVTEDGKIIVSNFNDNSLAVIDLDNPSNSIKYKNRELNNVLNNPTGILVTQDGRIIVSNLGDNSLAVIDLNVPASSIKYENNELNNVLNNPFGILVTQDGRIIVSNIRDNSLAAIDFEDMDLPKVSGLTIAQESDEEIGSRINESRKFLDKNSIFFSQNTGKRTNYLFNLFYLKEYFKSRLQEKINIYLTFLNQKQLAVLDQERIDELDDKIMTAGLNMHSLKLLFSFIERVDTRSLDKLSFTLLLGRWIELFTRLNKPNMEEPRDIFYREITSNMGFLRKDFDMEKIENDFVRIACLYLRGDIGQILSIEDRVDIKGELVNQIGDLSLEELNAAFNEFPEEVRMVSDLNSYDSLCQRVKGEDLGDIIQDINKAIYGQDKSENLFIREDVQNARDAILVERLAAVFLQEYYAIYSEDQGIDDKRLETLIPEEFQGRFREVLKERVKVLDKILAEGAKWERQQAVKSLVEEYRTARVEICSYIATGTNKWIFSIEDPAGMELSTIVGPLLVLDETTKLGSVISEGILGLGFYTNLADADEVWITTGIGDGRFFELRIVRADDDRWIVKTFKELKGDYKGTRIERIKNFKEDEPPDLDAAFMDYNVHRYVGAIQDTDIYYKGRRINETLNLLSDTKTPYGNIKFYENDSKYQRLTRSLLYVEYPKEEEYFTLAPEHFLRLILQRGLTIDLPAGIPLVRTRMTVSEKEIYLPVIQRAIAKACLQAIVKLYIYEGQFPPGLSEDYFSDDLHQDENGIFKGVKKDADNINKDRLDMVDFDRYLIEEEDDEDVQEIKNRSLKHLITLIEVMDDEGKITSLRKKKDDFLRLKARDITDIDQLKAELGLTNASQGFFEYIKEVSLGMDIDSATRSTPSKDYTDEEVTGTRELRDFKMFSDIVLGCIGMEDIEVGFYEKEERRLAGFGHNRIIWNLYHIRRYTEELKQILEGESDNSKIYEFFRKLLDYITHEASHFFDVGKASHESAEELVGLLAWRQKELIRRFVRSGKDWDDIMKELRSLPNLGSEIEDLHQGTARNDL